jgi:hypothetical protein
MARMHGLSARRRVATTNIDPVLNEFLGVPLHLDPPTDSPRPPAITPRRERRRRPNGTARLTNDDMINNRRRAFDLRHEKEVAVARRQSDREWDATLRFRDWKSKKAMERIERRAFVQKDARVLEAVISERNEHLLEAMKRANREVAGARMAATREVPVEIRAAAHAAKRSFFWAD